MTRKMSVKQLSDVLEINRVPLGAFQVEVDDTRFADLIFGDLTNKDSLTIKEEVKENIVLRVKTRFIKKIFDISDSLIRSNAIDGIEYTKDSFCNVDMEKMTLLGISEKEFQVGATVFIGGREVAALLGLKGYPNPDHYSNDDAFQAGRTWKYRKEAVIKRAQDKKHMLIVRQSVAS